MGPTDTSMEVDLIQQPLLSILFADIMIDRICFHRFLNIFSQLSTFPHKGQTLNGSRFALPTGIPQGFGSSETTE